MKNLIIAVGLLEFIMLVSFEGWMVANGTSMSLYLGVAVGTFFPLCALITFVHSNNKQQDYWCRNFYARQDWLKELSVMGAVCAFCALLYYFVDFCLFNFMDGFFFVLGFHTLMQYVTWQVYRWFIK